MRAIIRLALADLKRRWILILIMSILFSVAFSSYLSLITYQRSLSATYFSLNTNWLVVQQSNTTAEIHGSRLTPETGQTLINLGYDPIPEIHQVVGTSITNGIMMRGVNPEFLLQISPYDLLAGRVLQSNDMPRLAMVGVSLAERLQVGVGDQIKLRGRNFTVAGIFRTGSYEDGQAWVSLTDAQTLLNYGPDVSVYYIPDAGALEEGEVLAKGISVGRRGDSGNAFGKEVMSFLRYIGLVSGFLGIATIITLTNLLWRLAWLHRHDFGILRTLGFGKQGVLYYLLTQAAIITVLGMIIGGLFAAVVVLPRISGFAAFGISPTPGWDFGTISIITMVTVLITGIGIALPAHRINRLTTPELLGRDQ